MLNDDFCNRLTYSLIFFNPDVEHVIFEADKILVGYLNMKLRYFGSDN